jgi:hypothetical protein
VPLEVAWPQASAAERAELREAFRPIVEGWLADEATPAPTPSTAVTESPTAAAQRASAGLMASHNMYTNMSNVLLENHVGNMNAILNMGNNNYHYVYSKP